MKRPKRLTGKRPKKSHVDDAPVIGGMPLHLPPSATLTGGDVDVDPQRDAMIDVIVTNGQGLASGRAQARLTRTLETHGITAGRVTVAFIDENGPKGGPAMRCAIELRLPRRTLVRAEHTATTKRLALDGALDTVEGEVTKLIERRRDAARRPKKYYAAGRLLDGRRKTPNPND